MLGGRKMRIPLLPKDHLPASEKERDKQRIIDNHRRMIVQGAADRAGIQLKPLEMDSFVRISSERFPDNLDLYESDVRQEMNYFVDRNPFRVRASALHDYFDEDLTDEDRALREVMRWYENPVAFWFDTETTGLTYKDVAWQVGGVHLQTGHSFEFGFKPLSSARAQIRCSAGAIKAHGHTDAELAGLRPFEDQREVIDYLLDMVHGRAIMLCYFAKFDRDKFIATVGAALDRSRANGRAALASDLLAIIGWFGAPDHYIDVKETFIRAVGRGNEKGRLRIKLVDIARTTGALGPNEDQAHGAMMDAQLMDKIGHILSERGSQMAETKKGRKQQPPAESVDDELDEEQDIAQDDDSQDGMTPAEMAEQLATLNTALEQSEENRARAENNEKVARMAAVEKIEELEAKIEVFRKENTTLRLEKQKADERAAAAGLPEDAPDKVCEAEAKLIVNRIPVTIRANAAATPAEVVASVITVLNTVALLKDTERVQILAVEPEPTNQVFAKGKTIQPGTPPPAQKPPSQPPASQPPASKPPAGLPTGSKPPAQEPPDEPPDEEPDSGGQSDGPAEGAKGTRTYAAIARLFNDDGENKYRFWERRGDGKLSDYPKDLTNKNDIKTLETCLTGAGIIIDDMVIKQQYPINLRCDWVYGKLIKGSKYNARHKDKMRFTLLG